MEKIRETANNMGAILEHVKTSNKKMTKLAKEVKALREQIKKMKK